MHRLLVADVPKFNKGGRKVAKGTRRRSIGLPALPLVRHQGQASSSRHWIDSLKEITNDPPTKDQLTDPIVQKPHGPRKAPTKPPNKNQLRPVHHGASFLKLAPSAGRFLEESVQRMRSERPRDALASQHHLDASKSIQVTLAKYEASDGRYDLSSIGHSPTKSVRWMTVFSVSIGHFELQFLIGAGGRWSKKASKVRSMVEKTL
ncbi:hypothetical protein PGT21_025694 [Puccinia graminis f. sp. tritici]|uniref:Uncharacterized protein n=1 Tax=Puccinia graminis f. sp. tritici TaxID=56615 RepID=A0A5B0MFQ3_PUCGR|nr:hypothetical protein PGT21_025694 [Puccinia graminis f. sp. tritici]